MSFNRGVKRNAFGNRNFNRGSGGGGGGGGGGGNIGPGGIGMGGAGGGGSGGGGGGSRGGMNPWESGIMPGRGILPTPSNNLSLNSPQAQLVIASNLLSNLLRTQQDTQPQVPSLLSLGNNMNGPGSNFRGQQNYAAGRFNDRQMRLNIKNQRPQPYKKMGNRARDAVTGRRGPSAQQSRAQSQSGNQRINGNQNQHRNDKTSKPNPASKQNQTIKTEPQDVKTSDNEKADTQPIAKSEENDVTEDNKTEIKVENAEGDVATEIVNEAEAETKLTVESAEETAADTANNPTNTDSTASSGKKGDDNQLSGKKSEARHAESRYAAVPISHMFCHVCTKYMWDGFSFENHLRGRAHQLMMEKLDESYKLRVDFMRHELKVTEEQRELSLHNSKRRGKKVSVDLSVREYCTMCDLNFYGTLSSHRKGEKHQQLKIFLHPRCIPCAKEFPSRIEYDEHCLTPSHMVNVAQNGEQKKTKKNKLGKGESEVRSGEDEKKDMGPDPDSNEKDEELPENTEYLLDINDDMSNEKYKIPSYKYCRQNQIALGASLVKPVQGYHCEKCRRFVLTAEDMNLHIRTLTHYKNFVTEVKALTTPVVPEIKAEKSTENESSKDQEGGAQHDDDGGDAKRLKIEDSTVNESTPAINSELSNTTVPEDPADAAKKPDGNEIYDPLEADADSDDENKANSKKKDAETDEIQNEQSMEVWGDGDNDNEPQVGNLLDDDENEPMETQILTTQSQTPIMQSQTLATQPEPETQTPTILQPQTPSIQPQTPISQSQTPTTPPQIPTAQSQTPIAQPLQQQQLQSTLTVDINQVARKNNSPMSGSDSNTPQGKSPRGRGFRGRGHQRARRSRR